MWKRMMIALFMLLSAFSVGYGYNNLKATGTNYQVPTSATVKLGEMGQYPNGSHGSMVKGDKVYVGTNTETGIPMSFLLLMNSAFNFKGVYKL